MFSKKVKIIRENAGTIINDIVATHRYEREFLKTHKMDEIERLVRIGLYCHSPIVYKPSVQKESLGTSVYIHFNNKKYILTAGHIFTGGNPASLDNPLKVDLSKIYIGNGIPLLELKRGVIHPPAEKENYQEEDYALFTVNDEMAKKIEKVYSPVPISTTKWMASFYPKYAFLYGFPCSKNKGNKYSLGTIYDLCIRAPLNFNFMCPPGKNIALICNRDNVSSVEEMRNHQSHTLCKLNGMSGCGIWDIPEYPIENDPLKMNLSLCGIFTNYSSEDNALIGLHLDDIIDFLHKASNEIEQMKLDEIVYFYRRCCL